MPQDPPAGMGALCDCTVGDAMNCVESGRKCKCNTNMGYVLKEYDTLQSAADGNQYMKICVKETPCDKHVDGDGNSLCTENSRCVEDGDTASCVCTDDTYEADPDWTGEANGKCIKIDPCKSYSCDAIANSECTGSEVAQCMCSTGKQAYKKSGDDYAKFTDSVTFANTDDVKCVAEFPCVDDPCTADANMGCVSEDVAGLPTAYCRCDTGYGDASVTDNQVLAADVATLTCTDIDECATDAHNCLDSQDCKNSESSYTCTCKEGLFANTNEDSASAVPCVKCSGPGATENDGSCECTGDANSSNKDDDSSLCVCNSGYEDKDGVCTDIDECTTGTPCADSQDCTNTVGSYTCACKDGFLANTNADTNTDTPCIECSGPGAKENNGECTCSDDENATLSGSTCECNALYENKDGTCTLKDITNVADIDCADDTICEDFNAKCSESKCQCNIDIRAVLEDQDPALAHSTGIQLSKACVIKTECELFELSTPRGENSSCAIVGDEAACQCDDGFEEDAEYAANRDGGAINGKCSRIDPCNPAVGAAYDCSAIDHTKCVTTDDFKGACSCIENYLPYELETTTN